MNEEQGRMGEGRYKVFRGQVEAEATWIAHRTSWMLAANAFLVTAVAIASSGSTEKARDPGMASYVLGNVPALAVIVNAAIVAMIFMAEIVTIMRWWTYSKNPDEGTPSIVGAALPHLVGVAAPLVIGYALITFWSGMPAHS